MIALGKTIRQNSRPDPTTPSFSTSHPAMTVQLVQFLSSFFFSYFFKILFFLAENNIVYSTSKQSWFFRIYNILYIYFKLFLLLFTRVWMIWKQTRLYAIMIYNIVVPRPKLSATVSNLCYFLLVYILLR